MFYLETIHDYLENRPEIGKVLSVSSGIKLAEIANSGERLTDLELALLRKLLPEDIESQLLSAYITNDDNQVRLSARVIESYEGLNRKELKFNTIVNSVVMFSFGNVLLALFDLTA